MRASVPALPQSCFASVETCLVSTCVGPAGSILGDPGRRPELEPITPILDFDLTKPQVSGSGKPHTAQAWLKSMSWHRDDSVPNG